MFTQNACFFKRFGNAAHRPVSGVADFRGGNYNKHATEFSANYGWIFKPEQAKRSAKVVIDDLLKRFVTASSHLPVFLLSFPLGCGDC